MEQQQQLVFLLEFLLAELPQYRPWAVQQLQAGKSRRFVIRGLMNLRPPLPLQPDFLQVQDQMLAQERLQKGVVDAATLPVCARNPRLSLWQGDITRLQADAIVNAANSALLGCFSPCHTCIDNAIHSAAGLQLRQACYQLMTAQGQPEATGQVKVTKGYNLPARYVFHTVGPVVEGRLGQRQRQELASCYQSCLQAAVDYGLKTIAFCCISTGVFGFPRQPAAEIALATVENFLQQDVSLRKVIFNVFGHEDAALYRALLGPDR